MTSNVTSLRAQPNRLAQLLARDFCPSWDPYIQWLRQPLGWFVIGTIASILVGAFLSPLAWSLAAGLIALLVVSVVYPWLSVRGVSCQITCPVADLEEGQSQTLTLTIKNRWPWPVCGLIVEGVLVNPLPAGDDMEGPTGDVALATIPWLSQATFQVVLTPDYRGRYPLERPSVSCSFPLAMWTARRAIEGLGRVVVRPRRVRLSGLPEQSGSTPHPCGYGSRPGGPGDFLGLRSYRAGDSIRSIHWAATAKTDALVVCERGAAERSQWRVYLDPACSSQAVGQRENLAWRVRIAASLCTLLHQQGIPYQLEIAHEDSWTESRGTAPNRSRLEHIMDRLTDVPLDGCASSAAGSSRLLATSGCQLLIEPVTGETAGSLHALDLLRVTMHRTAQDFRSARREHTALIDLQADVATQVSGWLQRAEHGLHAA